MPDCPVCSKHYKKSGWLQKHLVKYNGADYSVSGNSIAKKRTILEFFE